MRSPALNARALLGTLLLVLGAPAQDPQAVAYRVAYELASPDRVDVTVELPAGTATPLEVGLPTWVPGERRPTESHASVKILMARTASGGALKVLPLSDGLWKIEGPSEKSLRLSYRIALPGPAPVLWHGARDGGLILDGARTLLFVKGLESRPATLEIAAPAGWALRTPLARETSTSPWRAASYRELAEALMILGAGRDAEVVVGERHLPLVIDQRGEAAPYDLGDVQGSLERLLVAAATITVPPRTRGPLLVLVEGATGNVARPGVVLAGLRNLQVHAQPLLLLGVVRDFLRGWIATRLPSSETAAFDGSSVPQIPTLWATDGFAEYLARRVFLRTGLAEEAAFLGEFTERVLARRNHLLAAHVSPEAASQRLYTAPWSEADGVDHALQGHLVALLLDIEIRAASAGARSLADVLRTGAARPTAASGLDAPAWEALISEVAGRDLAAFFEAYVHDPQPLPWDEVLPKAGLGLRLFEWKVRDPGLRCHFEGGLLLVGMLEPRSELFVAGLRPGDHLVAVNQRRVRTPNEVDRILARLSPGQKLRLDVRRDDRQRSIRLSLEDAVALEVPVEETPQGLRLTRIPPGPLENAGLLVGDILEKIDKRRITATQDIPAALRRVRGQRTLFTLRREGKRIRVPVEAPPRSFWRGSLGRDPEAPAAARTIGDGLLGRDDR